MLLIGVCAMANANTTYNVNLSSSTDILTGTITTNGKLGQLTARDFVGFSFLDQIVGTSTTGFSFSGGSTSVTCNSLAWGLGCGFSAVVSQQSNAAALIFDNVLGTGTRFASGSFSLDVGPNSWNFQSSSATYKATYMPTIGNYLLVASVPEPQTYAMFLSGLCLMGLIARRRRKS